MRRVADGLAVRAGLLAHAQNPEALLARRPAEQEALLAEARTAWERVNQRLQFRRFHTRNLGFWQELGSQVARLAAVVALLLLWEPVLWLFGVSDVESSPVQPQSDLVGRFSEAAYVAGWAMAGLLGFILLARAGTELIRQRGETRALRVARSQLMTVIRTLEHNARTV